MEKTKRSGQPAASEKQSTKSVGEGGQQEPEVMAPSKEEENNTDLTETSKSFEPGDLPKTSARDDDLAPGKLYSKALHTLRKDRQYAQAREQLVNFISSFPKHPYAPNAYYWLGETYYVQKDYSKSISIFEIGAKRFPDHDKAPDCLLKAGLAYLSIEENSKARNHFQRLISEYPSSSSSRIAKRKLTTLQ
jgi:tol-pal system protein YbgF